MTAKAEVAFYTIALTHPWSAILNFTSMLTAKQALPLLCVDGQTLPIYHYYCYYLVKP